MSMIDDIKRDRDAGTQGPWGWEVSLARRCVELCGGKGGSDLTVMSFARWGMQQAAPVFWKWTGNCADDPQRADKLAAPEKGREHHAKWFQRVDHPDARRIARVPDMEAALIAAEELADAVSALTSRPDSAHGGRLILTVDVNRAEQKLAAYRAATGAA